MQPVTDFLNQITEAILDFLKNFSAALLKDKIKIITVIIAAIGFLIILISAALN